MVSILGRMKNEVLAVLKYELYKVTNRGQKGLRKFTEGWKLLVRWNNVLETRLTLKDLKKYHSVEVSDFEKAWSIDDEPKFDWWVTDTPRKCNIIILYINTCIRKNNHKYSIETPTSVEHAYKIDKKNKNSLCRDAIKKEVHNVGIAF